MSKTISTWLRTHSLRVLGGVLILAAAVLLFCGQINLDDASFVVAIGCGMMGIAVKIDQVHASLLSVAQSGADCRTGNKAAAAHDLQPLAGALVADAPKEQV